LANPEMTITLTPLNSGEIFASHSGLAFLRSLIDYPHNNIKLIITTNGTLINRNRELIKNIKHLITDISISVDAATPETYSIVRGGDWQELVAGLEFLKSIGMSTIRFNYCIQKNNWQEIKSFAEFAMQYGFMITYQKLLNWGHWDTEWWHNNNVFDRTRDTFNLALDQVQAVLDQYPGKIKMAAELARYLQQRTESP
jgi:MoaA/NifB/PqqE/SkfB family radical SAM enzyme